MSPETTASVDSLVQAALPSSDEGIVKIFDIEGHLVNFYTTIYTYANAQRAEILQRGVSTNDFFRLGNYSTQEFIPKGNVPAYGGQQIILRYQDGVFMLSLRQADRELSIGQFSEQEIGHLKERNIPLYEQ